MARGKDRLTALQVKAAKPANTKSGMRLLGDGNGLFLQVTPAGKSWLYRYMIAGKAKAMGLGPYPVVTLAAARARVLEAGAIRYQGLDPRDERSAALTASAGAKTFDQVAAEYVATHAVEWTSPRHQAQWTSSIKRFASPVIGRVSVDRINKHHMMEILEPIWATKNPTASRLRERLERVVGYAIARDYRTGDNCALLSTLTNMLPTITHTKKQRRAMPYADVPALMLELQQQPDAVALALRLLVLTACRPNEVLGARWSEFDLTAGLWTIPKERMKARVAHTVTLSPAAVALVAGLPRDCELLFPDPKENSMRAALRALDHDDIDVHGFRSSFRTWAAECTNFPREIAELALAHAVGSQVERTYARTTLIDKRRELMTQWAQFCEPAAVADTVIRFDLARVG
jgi:integrase